MKTISRLNAPIELEGGYKLSNKEWGFSNASFTHILSMRDSCISGYGGSINRYCDKIEKSISDRLEPEWD